MARLSIRPGFNLATFAVITLIPLIAAAIFILSVQIQTPFRYDPAYFTPPYSERYNAPGEVAITLEQALRTDDQALLAELQGLRRPWPHFETNPNIRLTIMYASNERYFYYLYMDTHTYLRYAYSVERVGGRWVVAPPDAYYYLHSGNWMKVFAPLAAIWWVVELVVILAGLAYRTTQRWARERLPKTQSG
jgi:hypothetical protein